MSSFKSAGPRGHAAVGGRRDATARALGLDAWRDVCDLDLPVFCGQAPEEFHNGQLVVWSQRDTANQGANRTVAVSFVSPQAGRAIVVCDAAASAAIEATGAHKPGVAAVAVEDPPDQEALLLVSQRRPGVCH